MKASCVVGAAIALAAMFSIQARAALPSLTGTIIDWSTDTYVPPGFHGKQLPTGGSNVTAWVMLLNDGVPVDISDYTIYWYADGELLQSGQGLQRISFAAPQATEQVTDLQARVEDANGNPFVADIQVPVVAPKVAIEADYPGGIIASSSADIKALPYFFNVSGPSALTYAWSANGVPTQSAENPEEATLAISESTTPGTTISINLVVVNPSDSTTATANTVLTYQKS